MIRIRLAALAGALAFAVPAGAQEAPARCPADRGADVDWRLVRQQGFSFCVPLEWTADGPTRGGSDPGRWRQGPLRVSAGRGAPRLSRTIEVITISGDQLENLRADMRAHQSRETTEEIAGMPVQLRTYSNTNSGLVSIIAQWGGAGRGHLIASDESGGNTQLLMRIIRTMRPESAQAD